jgi:hypothetical protein
MKPRSPLLSVLLGCAVTLGALAAPKIVLEPWMVTGENSQVNLTVANAGPASALVDEQALSGDPLAGAGGAPVRYWFPGWNSGFTRYPASAVVDLRAEYDLTAVCLRDGEGSGDVTVSTGLPFEWSPLFTDAMTRYNQWSNHVVTVRTRYLRVTLAGQGGGPKELVVYGTIVPGQTPKPQPAALARRRTTIDELIGINAFIDDPLGVIEQAGNVREYHNWQWDEGDTNPAGTYPVYPANANAWAPSWAAGGAWDFDAYYNNLHRLGLEVTPAVWRTPSWLMGTGAEPEMKPFPLGAGAVETRDPLEPASYLEHADHLFQYLARYGALPVADGQLKLRAGQPRRTGLGSLRFLENWNEQDKWWKGRAANFSPFEYAAMTSADWDGHRGALGANAGMANADPSAALVMGGLAVADADYLRAMRLWFDFRRGGDNPLAALNLHHYCNDAGGQGGTATTGISPEADGLRERFAALVDHRNRYWPDSELWVTEFGWDVDARSPQRAPSIAGMTAEETQARWIVRGWLELAAAGVDRGHQYMLRDVLAPGSTGGEVKYTTSGLVGPKGNWAPRTSWYYQATLRQRLRGLRYHDSLTLEDPQLRASRFVDAEDRVRALAVWSATSTGRTVSGIRLPVPAGVTRATQVEFAPGQLAGIASELPVAAGSVTVEAGEKPVLVLFAGRNARPRLPDRRLTLVATQVVNEAGAGDATLLVDEQAAVGDPDMGSGGRPTTTWNPGYSAGLYPASARLDLGLRRRVTKVYLHDFNAAGPFTLESGAPGAWRPLAEDPLTRYAAWSPHVPTGSTRHLRLTMGSSSANVSEVALYARAYSGYGDWAERAFPGTEDFAAGDAAPGADPDGDGVCNLLEYALGGDAGAADTGLLPVVALQGDRLTLTYVRDLWLRDVSWAVEWSTDLVNWSAAGVGETVELATPDFERRRAEVAVAGRPRLFLRLGVGLSAAP